MPENLVILGKIHDDVLSTKTYARAVESLANAGGKAQPFTEAFSVSQRCARPSPDRTVAAGRQSTGRPMSKAGFVEELCAQRLIREDLPDDELHGLVRHGYPQAARWLRCGIRRAVQPSRPGDRMELMATPVPKVSTRE